MSKHHPFSARKSCRNLLRCPHRCQFDFAETRVGCINLSRLRSMLTRRGVPSKTTPLRVGVERNPLKVVQLQRVEVGPKCGRCCRPQQVLAAVRMARKPTLSAIVLMTEGRMALQPFRATGDVNDAPINPNPSRHLPELSSFIPWYLESYVQFWVCISMAGLEIRSCMHIDRSVALSQAGVVLDCGCDESFGREHGGN